MSDDGDKKKVIHKRAVHLWVVIGEVLCVVQQPELSSYTVEQIKAYAQGTWLDEIQLTDDSAVRLYDINDDGLCDIYDFNFNEESEDEEGLGSYVTYNGTWSVTNDLSKLHFVDQLNFNDLELNLWAKTS